MLPKNQRLTSNRIEYLLKKGKKTGNDFFTIKYLPNQLKTKSRFCVIVSSKIHPKAVERNRLRRQIFEIFRLHPALPSAPADIVVIAKTPLTKLNYQELTGALTLALKNLITPS